MSLEVRIDGAATLRKLAAQMRAEGNKDRSRAMGKALGDAAEPVKASVMAEAEKTMPSSGGYASLLTKSLRFRMSRRNSGREAQVILITYADGTKERRDIVALEKGQLRHPHWGRSSKLKRGVKAGTIIRHGWSVTKILPGFHKRGTADAMDNAQDAMLDVIEEYARDLVK
jgi:hypothetical protein